MKNFQPHISFSQIADYTEGRLSPDERTLVEVHLAGCSECYRQVTNLERMIARMRSDDSLDAPAHLIRHAIQMFRSQRELQVASPGLRHRVLAVLQFDSLDLSPGFGMRTGRPASRQILYRAGANEIDLRIEPTDQEWIVSGQVFGEAASNDRVVLQGRTMTSQTTLNEAREFILPPVQEGVYTLLLNLQETDVQIDEIRIGP